MNDGAPELYPWQRESWRTLKAAWRTARPPSGLLLSAPPGAGLERLAERLQYFLFQERSRHAANSSKAGRLLAAGAHPDLLKVEPEPPAQTIRREQLRDLLRFWELGSRFGGTRMVLLSPAEALQRGACDVLLKLLEEAPPATLLVFLAERTGTLPATLRSRCLQLLVPCRPDSATLDWLRERLPPGEDADAWLRLTRTGPLAVQEMVARGEGALREQLEAFLAGRERRPALQLAADWQQWGAARVLEWLRLLVIERIRARIEAGGQLPLGGLIDYYEVLARCRRELESSSGARESSLLEESVLALRHPRPRYL